VYSCHAEYIKRLIIEIRLRQYSIRTEHAYLSWFLRFEKFNKLQEPVNLNETHIASFLEFLIIERKVSSSTKAQALNAIMFFYRHVVNKEFSEAIEFTRSKKPKRLPVVLSRTEIKHLFECIDNDMLLIMAKLLYGCGMRFMECVRLRVIDVDFDYRQIIIRQAKGRKDRVVPVPDILMDDLRSQIIKVKFEHKADLA